MHAMEFYKEFSFRFPFGSKATQSMAAESPEYDGCVHCDVLTYVIDDATGTGRPSVMIRATTSLTAMVVYE